MEAMTPDPQAAPLSAEEMAEAHPHWRLGVEHMAWHRRWIANWKARAEAAESALTAERKAKASPHGGVLVTCPSRETLARWYFEEHYGYSLTTSSVPRVSAFGSGEHRDADRISYEMADRIMALTPQDVSAAKVGG